MTKKQIAPELQREVIRCAAKQRMGFFDTLNYLIFEGLKALGGRLIPPGYTTEEIMEEFESIEQPERQKKGEPFNVDGLWIR